MAGTRLRNYFTYPITEAIPVQALRILITGIVQGVGFRPFVYRLAHQHQITGRVQNTGEGVLIHAEGPPEMLQAFLQALQTQAPPAAYIDTIHTHPLPLQHYSDFQIISSTHEQQPLTGISPDLHLCEACLKELFNPTDRRYHYPYINCTHCGPRYSIILALPYDRAHTTMRSWPMCAACKAEYEDPTNRRFHAQPIACPTCGPTYFLHTGNKLISRGYEAICQAAHKLRAGKIIAIKGLGGYHLACDAQNEEAVHALRVRKYRKEKPFALMAASLEEASQWVKLSSLAKTLLTSVPHPIVLLPRRPEASQALPSSLAPNNEELGIMLPYTPLHFLLFDAGAPPLLVMTSANRSNEPIAYEDEDALLRLKNIADFFLIGERPIARRLDDSVLRITTAGPLFIRRSRGYAPEAVTTLPTSAPILAVGADLKNTITLAIEGKAYVSQYLGDLEHYPVQESFHQTINDLLCMYGLTLSDVQVVHDAHPGYLSTLFAQQISEHPLAIQHHRAHLYAVLAERRAWEQPVVGFSFDGTGYGDDGSIWGGEVFAGSLQIGLKRIAHLYPAYLPGGDAAARHPVQAAAGFLAQLSALPDLEQAPFHFPPLFKQAQQLVSKQIRTFPTTSMGRLFDTIAALVGFNRPITFEGQAAIWLEHQARQAAPTIPAYPFPAFDYRPLLHQVIEDRLAGVPPQDIAMKFHKALALTILEQGTLWGARYQTNILVLAGGVFQNALLIHLLFQHKPAHIQLWLPQYLAPNDESISLGQAAATCWHQA